MIQSSTEKTLINGGLKRKFDQLKKLITQDVSNKFTGQGASQSQSASLNHSYSTKRVEIMACQKSHCQSSKETLMQAPIILERQKPNSAQKSKKTIQKIDEVPRMPPAPHDLKGNRTKVVEPFEPIQIPVRQRKIDSNIQTTVPCKPTTKQIQIHIEKEDPPEDKNKDCLKKLFKKITKLTDELAQCEKQKNRLAMQLQFLNRDKKRSDELDKKYREASEELHKLRLDLATLREQLVMQKSKPPQIVQKIVNQPIEVIKQVPVQKIVQVKVEVPKAVPGPQRIVEKRVEVPKIIEVQKKVPVQIVKEVIKEVPRQIIKTVEIPSYIEKPVYIDKPVYVDRIVENKVEVPVEVPIEVPVYIDRPVFQAKARDTGMEQEIKFLITKNTSLETELSAANRQILEQKYTIQELYRNIEILRRHNEDKNREVQALIHNSFDQFSSADLKLRQIPLHSPIPSPSYFTNNYTISSDSIPPIITRPRFI